MSYRSTGWTSSGLGRLSTTYLRELLRCFGRSRDAWKNLAEVGELVQDPAEGQRRLEQQMKHGMDVASVDVTSSVTKAKIVAPDKSKVA